MTFPTRALVVVHLMTTLCATTLSEEIPLTCPDTARRSLEDISRVYDCTPWFYPEEKVATCDGFHFRIVPGSATARVFLTFEILEEFLHGTAMCLGLKTLSAGHHLREEHYYRYVSYDIDFNPLLAVGVLTADHNTSKTYRSYSISLLSDVLNLPIFSQFNVQDASFWNFSSPLFGIQMNWIQSFKFEDSSPSLTTVVTLLERLKNTSIKTLNVRMVSAPESKTILVRDLPFLRVMNFDGVGVYYFHQDSFLGMPQMEVLILQDIRLSRIPEMVDRMPKLKRLEIVRSSSKFFLNFPAYQLSTLKDLEVLNLKSNRRPWFTTLPTLLKLRKLNLDDCKLSTIGENDFERFPVLEELTLSNNELTHLKEDIFSPLKRLKLLDLSFNKLTNWPELYDFSFILLDLSHNLLSDICNLGQNRTTVDILNISNNKILHWDDKYVFSNQKSLIPNDDQRKELNMTHSEDSSKENIFTSGSKTNLLHRIPSNRSVENFYDQTKLSKSEEGEKIIVNTSDYSSHWVNTINISYNSIPDLSQTMMQSLEGIHEVDLGGNIFKCVDCRMIPFQKWLNTTSTNVTNLGTLDPLLCWYPVTQRGTPVNLVQYDEEPCLEKILVRTTSPSLLMHIGIPVGLMSIFVATVAGVIYKYRLPISYMLHLYRIRRRALDFSRSAFNKHAFDAFICYSSQDRRFVLTRLVPLLEKGEEGYCLCLHERDFPLGSYIVSNIIGSIQHSRKTIIVLSEHFVSSKWCKWELEMTQHKMFHEDEHFVILIQLEKLDRNELPRHLQFMMDTRTFLEWPPPGHDDEEDVAAERLKEALGPSILQTTREKPPALSDLMEDY